MQMNLLYRYYLPSNIGAQERSTKWASWRLTPAELHPDASRWPSTLFSMTQRLAGYCLDTVLVTILPSSYLPDLPENIHITEQDDCRLESSSWSHSRLLTFPPQIPCSGSCPHLAWIRVNLHFIPSSSQFTPTRPVVVCDTLVGATVVVGRLPVAESVTLVRGLRPPATLPPSPPPPITAATGRCHHHLVLTSEF